MTWWGKKESQKDNRTQNKKSIIDWTHIRRDTGPIFDSVALYSDMVDLPICVSKHKMFPGRYGLGGFWLALCILKQTSGEIKQMYNSFTYAFCIMLIWSNSMWHIHKRTTEFLRLLRTDLITEDSTLFCSASDTVWRAMASLAAICFFFKLFKLCDGDHSWTNTKIVICEEQTKTKANQDKSLSG